MCETALVRASAVRHTEVVRFTPLFIVLCTAPACSSAAASGGQTGEESAGCVVAEQRELGRDEASPIGVVPADVFALVDGPFATRLWWSERAQDSSDGTSTAARLAFIASDEPARFVREEMRGNLEIALGCGTYVAVSGELEFNTDDGSFDERWPATLRAAVSGVAETSVKIDWSALGGDYDFSRLVPEGSTAANGYGSFSFRTEGAKRLAEGTITGIAETRTGDAVGAMDLRVGTIRDDQGGTTQ